MPSKLAGFFPGTEMPTSGWWEALWPDPAAVLAAVGLRADMGVIDLCCGNGWFTLQIAKLARHVSALDLDAELLDAARQRLAENGLTNCSFVRGDAYDVARLIPEPVDFVFMANAFHGVPAKARLAGAVRAVLRPGGHFAVVNWHRRSREQTPILGEARGPETELRLSPEQTIAAITPSGLILSQVTELPPHHYAAVFKLPGSGNATDP